MHKKKNPNLGRIPIAIAICIITLQALLESGILHKLHCYIGNVIINLIPIVLVIIVLKLAWKYLLKTIKDNFKL